MRRINRKDRVLLENLGNKYGNDVVASALMSIAARKYGQISNNKDGRSLPQEAVLEYIKYLEGVRIRLREIHWSVDKNSLHKLTDDMISEIEKTEDDIAEDLMGFCGFRIKVGEVVPNIPSASELGAVISELTEKTIELEASIEGDKKFNGIINVLDDLIHYLNKSDYLSTFA